MAFVLLDATVLIDLMRQRPGAIRRLHEVEQRGDRPSTSPIAVEELVRGLRPAEETRAEGLIEGLWSIPLDNRVAWKSGEWRQAFAKKGQTLSQGDCLIASAAYLHGATLATGNPKDFPMYELSVEHWPVNE